VNGTKTLATMLDVERHRSLFRARCPEMGEMWLGGKIVYLAYDVDGSRGRAYMELLLGCPTWTRDDCEGE